MSGRTESKYGQHHSPRESAGQASDCCDTPVKSVPIERFLLLGWSWEIPRNVILRSEQNRENSAQTICIQLYLT